MTDRNHEAQMHMDGQFMGVYHTLNYPATHYGSKSNGGHRRRHLTVASSIMVMAGCMYISYTYIYIYMLLFVLDGFCGSSTSIILPY